ncbi:hypothetical protein ACQP25_44710 (plasmid) [Microtetraspora malaysiensis]|uniref:hypothetical protein n=1 Tax=Microtetraspora malaysiensis TaxID=161358 RepID=UPI003D93BA38
MTISTPTAAPAEVPDAIDLPDVGPALFYVGTDGEKVWLDRITPEYLGQVNARERALLRGLLHYALKTINVAEAVPDAGSRRPGGARDGGL